MMERQKNPHGAEETQSKESTGMKSYKDLIERMKKQSGVSNDISQRQQTLEHPLPRDAGPPGLRSSISDHTTLFERLGAISGMPPSSVNDSIMASWMTSALSASATRNNNHGKHVSNQYLMLYVQ